MQVVALDCLLQHQRSSSLPLSVLSTLVQLAIPFCILLFFVLFFCLLHLWSWHKHGANPGWYSLRRRLKVTTYAVLGFFYTSLTQAALNLFSCYQIDYPVPAGTPYPQFLQASRASSCNFASSRAYGFAISSSGELLRGGKICMRFSHTSFHSRYHTGKCVQHVRHM